MTSEMYWQYHVIKTPAVITGLDQDSMETTLRHNFANLARMFSHTWSLASSATFVWHVWTNLLRDFRVQNPAMLLSHFIHTHTHRLPQASVQPLVDNTECSANTSALRLSSPGICPEVPRCMPGWRRTAVFSLLEDRRQCLSFSGGRWRRLRLSHRIGFSVTVARGK